MSLLDVKPTYVRLQFNLHNFLTFTLTFLAISIPLCSPDILELTIEYESNLQHNATRKRQKYENLIKEQRKHYEKVKFVNLSISSLGVFSESSLGFIEMLKDLKFDEKCRKYFVRKMINTCIRILHILHA